MPKFNNSYIAPIPYRPDYQAQINYQVPLVDPLKNENWNKK